MISLCRFDIAQVIMSLSWFHHCPHIGHVQCLKCVCGYICKFPQGAICFQTGIPDHETLFGTSPTSYDWMEAIYGSPVEVLPDDAPPPTKGNQVCTSTNKDAHLLHDLTTGSSASGILHFLNQTPIDAFSKWPMDLQWTYCFKTINVSID